MSVTVVVRRVSATPARAAAETWRVIADLIAPTGSDARREIDAAGGIGMSLIASEAMRSSPMVVLGGGARLRIYCVHDDEAILGEGVSEDPLTWCPTDGDWAMSLPCPEEDLSWIQSALAKVSARITARDLAATVPSSATHTEVGVRSGEGNIDVEAFLRS
jgi:hypothetical protein